MKEFPCQLYLISPTNVGGDFPQILESALSAGPVAAFQFRVKDVDQHEAAALAEPLQAVCAAHDVAFIVNDSVALAKRLKADGVHLGQGDGDVREARETLGPDAQIGVTCHNSRHLAMEAAEAPRPPASTAAAPRPAHSSIVLATSCSAAASLARACPRYLRRMASASSCQSVVAVEEVRGFLCDRGACLHISTP